MLKNLSRYERREMRQKLLLPPVTMISKKAQKELDEIIAKLKDETIRNGKLNSLVSATTFEWESAHAHNAPEAGNLFKN